MPQPLSKAITSLNAKILLQSQGCYLMKVLLCELNIVHKIIKIPVPKDVKATQE